VILCNDERATGCDAARLPSSVFPDSVLARVNAGTDGLVIHHPNQICAGDGADLFGCLVLIPDSGVIGL